MDITDKLCALLEQKKALFLEYEQATSAMLDCAVEDVEHYITRRGQKATEIDEVSEQIAAVCGEVPGAPLLLQIAAGKKDFERTPGEYHAVFYAAASVSSVIYRIGQSEGQVKERLTQLRDEAKDAIRQNQNLPKIKKYLTGLSGEKEMNLKNEKA